MGEWGVGMPAAVKLEQFGEAIHDAFGEYAYQVGSSLTTTSWRDVDVRLILSDEKYAQMFGDPVAQQSDMKWVAFVRAFSALGREMTGLPIDFQIQQQSKANRDHEGARNALGIRRALARQRPTREPTAHERDTQLIGKLDALGTGWSIEHEANGVVALRLNPNDGARYLSVREVIERLEPIDRTDTSRAHVDESADHRQEAAHGG